MQKGQASLCVPLTVSRERAFSFCLGIPDGTSRYSPRGGGAGLVNGLSAEASGFCVPVVFTRRPRAE